MPAYELLGKAWATCRGAERSIADSDPKLAPSGVHLGRALEQLGVADAVRPKTILRTPFDGGVELVARGEAELGVYLVTEIRMTEGVKLAGLLPAEVQPTWSMRVASPLTVSCPRWRSNSFRFLPPTMRASLGKRPDSSLSHDTFEAAPWCPSRTAA